MATVGESDSSLAAQCLDFCKALTSQGKAFQFSLNIGSTFSFTLDTSCKDSPVSLTKKRARPSTLRKSAKHKEEFAEKKSKPEYEQEEVLAGKELTSQSSTFQCDQCEKVFKQEECCIGCCTWWMYVAKVTGSCWMMYFMHAMYLISYLIAGLWGAGGSGGQTSQGSPARNPAQV